MSYDPMHAINYVNWYLGSAAGIGKDELGEHIKEANYRYVNRSSLIVFPTKLATQQLPSFISRYRSLVR
jgi:hypothetical protein